MIHARLSQRIEAVIRRRAAAGVPPLRISGRRIYILPTGTGVLFGVLLTAMLIGATNYGNNLAFTLTFWLGAAALVSMHRVHRNLAGLRVESVQATPVFAGERAVFAVALASDARLARRGLLVRADGGQTDPTPLRLARGASVDRDVSVHASARGQRTCPPLVIETRHPMGLFRCWTRVTPSAAALVYPHPAGDCRLPGGEPTRGATDSGRHRGDAVFAGHRRYQPGDSPRRVDWKASARSDALLVKQHAETPAPTRWFDYDALEGLDREARLSQLALWVVEADRAGAPYALRLANTSFGPAGGMAHRHACLKALALF